MKKFQQFKMEEEYWHALTDACEVMDYKSRHDLVVTILKTWVEQQAPESLKLGLEKMRYLESRKVVAPKNYEKMASVMIPSKSIEYSTRTPIKLIYRDGREVMSEGIDALEAFKLHEVDMSLTVQDFHDRIQGFKMMKS